MTLLDMSLAGTAIILAASLIRVPGRDRLPRRTFDALWVLAVLRLTVPAALPFRWSVWSALARTAERAASAAAATAAAAPALAAEPDLAAPGQLVDGIMGFAPAALPAAAPIPWRTVLWALGACALALLLTVRYIRAERQFRKAEAVDDSYVNQFLAAHPLRRRVSARVSDRIGAPLTYGVLRPVILLPRSMDLRDRDILGYVLAHETAHIRRLDALRKLLLRAVVCLHWFNPAVWLMLVLATRDMELACDEAVVRSFGPDARRSYAHALLDMEERRSGLTGLASGFSKNAIEERIHSIMKIRKRSFLSVLLALALVSGVGAAFATAAAPETEPEAADTAPTVFSGDVMVSLDGTTLYVFTAEGEPISMTEEEYKAIFQPAEVEWWTAEEYAEWLEQEKKDLQDCLGAKAWTSSDGWFIWDQEKIDETIAMYEQVLEQIKDGLLVSRTVDGSADTVLAQGAGEHEEPLDDYWQSVRDEERQMEEEALADRASQWEDTLAPYAPFGVTYAYDGETDEMLLFWNGQEVRGLWDGETGIWISEHGGPGGSAADAPELIAVYDEDGELTGLREATAEEQAEWDGLRASAAMNDHLSALMFGDGSAPEYALAGCTDFRGRLGPYEKIYFDLGHVSADETITAATQSDKDMGLHVTICLDGEDPGDYLTTVSPEEAASNTAAEPKAYNSTSRSLSDTQSGNYSVCVWSSVNEPIEFALSYKVS